MSDVVFRRIHGRIVPIKKKSGVNSGLAASALATNIVSGVVSGLSIVGSGKRVLFGQSASFGLDILSSAQNIAATKDIRNKKTRLQAIGRGEVINNLAGYSAFGVTALAHKPTREAFISGSKSILSKLGSLVGRAAL